MKPRPKIKHIGIVAAMNEPSLFQPFFAGESWDHWRTVLKGAFALPMSDDEREFSGPLPSVIHRRAGFASCGLLLVEEPVRTPLQVHDFRSRCSTVQSRRSVAAW